jgi:GTP-binding protein HflX
VHVVDASNPKRSEQMSVVYKTLKELGADEKPVITVFNKADKEIEMPLPLDERAVKTLPIAAKTGMNTDKLVEEVEEIVRSFKRAIEVVIPYDKGNLLSIIHGNCEIVDSDMKENGYYFKIYADEEAENRLNDYKI